MRCTSALGRSCCKSTSRSGLESGQAAVEALLALWVLLLLTFGGIILAQGVVLRSAMDSSTAAAARALSLDPDQWAFAGELIQGSVDRNALGVKPAVAIQVYDSSGRAQSPGWLAGLDFGDGFILEASAPFDPRIPLLASRPVTIRVRHWGIVERYP